MDGENNGTPYEQMDDLGGNTLIFGNSHIFGVGEKGVFHEAENLEAECYVTIPVPEKGNNYTLKLEISIDFFGGRDVVCVFFFGSV